MTLLNFIRSLVGGADPNRTTADWEILRTKPLGRTRGLAFPSFIRNVQYHYSPLKVYADGLIDCWGCVDLNLFQQKIKNGWIATQAPRDAVISIFNLGMATVGNADWQYSPTQFARQVERAIDTMNPTRGALLDMHGEEVENRNGVRVSKFGMPDGRPYFVDPTSNCEVLGDSMPVLLRVGSEIHLSHWFVFADGSSKIGKGSDRTSTDEIAKRFDDGDLATSAPDGELITIPGLGQFQALKTRWGVKPRERVREAMDKIAMLKGDIGSVQNCRECFKQYQQSPGAEAKQLLREAYESVPEHQRRFCGNMDSKDAPIRKILYH